MLIKAKTLEGYKLGSLDGEIGKVKQCYFDDRHWMIRYVVAETGSWLFDRQVLISPYAIVAVHREQKNIAVELTRKQIEGSPPLESDRPVSLQFEQVYFGYYGLPPYWDGPYGWGANPYLIRDPKRWTRKNSNGKSWNPHLRSTHGVSGHHIQASDGEIGHVEDFIIDAGAWVIRYFIVATGSWWEGKKVLVSPKWIERISWDERKVFVNLSRESVQHSPEYTEDALLTRDYEIGLHGHYKREGYWLEDTIVG